MSKILLLPNEKGKIVEKTVQAEQKKEKKYMGTQRLYPGHSFFRLNLTTGMIDNLTLDFEITLDGGTKCELKAEPGHLYVAALNFKNAERKFIKQLNKMKNNGK